RRFRARPGGGKPRTTCDRAGGLAVATPLSSEGIRSLDGGGVLPYLRSFPTRRSSDLRTGTRRARRPPTGSPSRRTRSRGVARDRSEEHTSELQSPDHLVCRLLLEKKKKA